MNARWRKLLFSASSIYPEISLPHFVLRLSQLIILPLGGLEQFLPLFLSNARLARK
jgi:hypothetical protein